MRRFTIVLGIAAAAAITLSACHNSSTGGVPPQPIPPAHFGAEYALTNPASVPEFVTVGPDGNIWFNEASANNVAKITASGVITEYAVPTLNSGPEGITAGPDGALWFCENSANKIGRVTLSGSFTEFK